jgi:hypothetical protein
MRIHYIAFLLLATSLTTVANATSPCISQDHSELCHTLGGTWTSSREPCMVSGTCTPPIPLFEYDCKSDADCKPCGIDECKPDLSKFPKETLDVLYKLPDFDRDAVSACAPPTNQLCGCVNSRCVVKSPSVACRVDSDCHYCCGSCVSTAWNSLTDCVGFCILKKEARFDCQCLNNTCKRLGPPPPGQNSENYP